MSYDTHIAYINSQDDIVDKHLRSIFSSIVKHVSYYNYSHSLHAIKNIPPYVASRFLITILKFPAKDAISYIINHININPNQLSDDGLSILMLLCDKLLDCRISDDIIMFINKYKSEICFSYVAPDNHTALTNVCSNGQTYVAETILNSTNDYNITHVSQCGSALDLAYDNSMDSVVEKILDYYHKKTLNINARVY